jgi:HD-like signal output (HDOD) protein
MRLSREQIAEDLQALGDLPTLSPVVAHLTATLSRDDVGLLEVEEIILRDPVVAAKVLSAANAAAYASHTPTTTIRAALMRLGLVRVRRLALLMSLYNAMPGQRALEVAYWRHSLAVAHAADVVARYATCRPADANPDTVFLAGLLHDLGVLVLADHYPRHHAAVVAARTPRGPGPDAAPRGNLPRWEAEREVLGLDHGTIGACLAEHWAFPSEITAAIQFHHRPAEAPPEHAWATAVVHVADAAAASEPAWDLGEGAVLLPDAPALAALGLAGAALDTMLEEMRTEARRATTTLEGVG